MGFTKNEIVKIYEIFNRVVDCQGNLKVFRGFDWDASKELKIIEEKSIGTNNFSREIIQTDKSDTGSLNLEEMYQNPRRTLSICGYINNIGEIENNMGNTTNFKSLGITLEHFDIAKNSKYIKNQADTHFSILLYKFHNLTKNDFATLYTAFDDILEICGFNTSIGQNDDDGNHTILYLNIFQKVLDYFKNNEKKLYVTSNKNVIDISTSQDQTLKDVCKKLDLAFKIRKILCLLLAKTTSSGKGKPLTEAELREILGDLYDLFKEYAKEILEALDYFNAHKRLTNGSKNTIHYGAPGTGKTRLVKKCLAVLDPSGEYTEWVQFHSGYEYEDFIDGIRPVGVSGGNLQLDIVNGAFKNFCIKATENLEKPYFFIVDEINRANVSAVFGETLSLLEESYRGESNAIRTKNSVLIENDTQKAEGLSVTYKDGKSKFYIPENIYFIGMMNDVDKSIDCFDLALRRRFTWVLHECDYGSLNGLDDSYITKCKKLNSYITGLNHEAEKEKITDKETKTLNLGRAYEIGQSYFLKKAKMSEKEIWDLHIEPILREYIRSQFGEDDIGDKLDKAKEIFVG